MVHRPAPRGHHHYITLSVICQNRWITRELDPSLGGATGPPGRRLGAGLGLSPPLIETDQGWIMIYHGVRDTASGSLYRLGLAFFDLENPEVCLRRGDTWVFGPEADYEREGDVNNVVFPCGYTVGDDGDTLHLYYGGADTFICLATASIREMLDWLDRQERIEAEPMPIAEQSPPAL